MTEVGEREGKHTQPEHAKPNTLNREPIGCRPFFALALPRTLNLTISLPEFESWSRALLFSIIFCFYFFLSFPFFPFFSLLPSLFSLLSFPFSFFFLFVSFSFFLSLSFIFSDSFSFPWIWHGWQGGNR